MIHSGGKLLRPAYQLLFSQFGEEQDRKKAICLAAAIEMLHTERLSSMTILLMKRYSSQTTNYSQTI